MMLRIVERRHQPDSVDMVLTLEKVFKKLVADIGLPDWSFDLVLVEDDAMATLNSQFRSKASVTDVLSFSYLLHEGDGPCDLPQGSLGAGTDLWLDELAEPGEQNMVNHIGEVILAPDFISSRCEEQSWVAKDEFPMLVVHGALHLLGWDHQEETEGIAMQCLEEKHLRDCGLTHPMRTLEGH